MRKSPSRKAVAWIVILLITGAGAIALHFGAAGEPAKRGGGARRAPTGAQAASIAALAGGGSLAASTAVRKYVVAAEHGPDLTVTQVDASGVTGDWQTLQIGGSAIARIVNRGDTAASVPFKVTFFEDANADGLYEAGLDRVLGATTVGGLGAGASANASAAVSGAVLFRDNLVHAFADSENAVAESSETNNVGASGSDCEFLPQPGAFHPIVEWAWTGSPTAPDSRNVLMTPAVIDLDRDGRPEIVFASTASRTGNSVEVGVLRAVRGDSGAELFTVTDPALRVNAASSVAAADIDLDGYPEIVACDESGARVIVFEHDGTFKWRSQPLEAIHWGAPSIADLNADGHPEIVVGRQALSATGALLWTGTGGRAAQAAFTGPLSIVADINLDGIPEVIAGNTVYRADGSTLWMAPLGDGYNAVANFDADPEPEIVLVSYGEVFLLEHDGSIAWGPRAIPGGGDGGPPTVADFDGDGSPEIGVAGAQRYVVLETNGALKWESPTQDLSSNVTGSSVFDFDGDLSAEVVYRDELNLRVYRGRDGAVLFQTPMSSCTWFEYVLVADVDADGNAEMVAVANDSCWYGQQQGVFVLGDANDLWVATRRIWNQHAYHITNVNDDGTIPAIEADNWLTPAGKPFNNYRQNVLNGLSPLAAPDLTASRITFGCGPGTFSVTARIGNGGAILAGAGLPVSFYRGEPGPASLLGTARTPSPLAPGGFVDIALTVPGECRLQSGFITVVADDAGGLVGTQNECDETNNRHAAEIPPLHRCGDGVTDGDEQCDDGNTAGGDGCAANCTLEPRCGDGTLDPGEECDDGNTAGGDGCAPDCRLEPRCGDGALDPGEECDDGNTAGGDGCAPDCRIERVCGNGRVEPGEQCDDGNTTGGDGCAPNCTLENRPPDCSGAGHSPAEIWPPNHKLTPVAITGLSDPDGDPVTVIVTGIRQDEPVDELGDGATCPDARGIGTAGAFVRAERAGVATDRVYHIAFTASDGHGGSCTGIVRICVPHDRGLGQSCRDEGPLYDSTGPCRRQRPKN